MRKNFIGLVLIFIILLLPYNGYAMSTVDATEKIDIGKDCSLTLNYYYDNYNFDDLNVKIYYVASVEGDFQYHLSSSFSSLPVKINGLRADNEWDSLKDTLNAYIMADDIKELLSYSNQKEVISISGLKTGLYFVKTEKIDTSEYTLLFEPFLISIPNLEDGGTWNYDVSVYPKVSEYIYKYNKIKYTILKEWRDNKDSRPESVDIEIYKDGEFVDSQVLSSSNNWIYEFDAYDDGSEYFVVERNVLEDYDVSIVNKDNKFIIINTDSNYKVESPKTFDNVKLYLYLFVGSLIGVVLLIIGLVIGKKNLR